MAKDTIGVVGGMGSYATLHFFGELLKAFPAVKEWDRPRIIIDNRCDMPSRVRAYLYGEKREELVSDLESSIGMLVQNGAKYIVLACNTSHIFLDDIYCLHPEYRDYIVNIIDECARSLVEDDAGDVFLLASEGTIQSGIYDRTFADFGLSIKEPDQLNFDTLRRFIEAVKQDNISPEILDEFVAYVNSRSEDTIVLGCTELPVLYDSARDRINKKVYDPLYCAILAIKRAAGTRERV